MMAWQQRATMFGPDCRQTPAAIRAFAILRYRLLPWKRTGVVSAMAMAASFARYRHRRESDDGPGANQARSLLFSGFRKCCCDRSRA